MKTSNGWGMARVILAVCAWVTGVGLVAQWPPRSVDSFDGLPSRLPRASYSFVDALPGVALEQPVATATPPGETHRLFVVEKTGRIVVITNLARPTRTVFANLTTNLLTSGEQGLLGLAFHPRYAENRRLFVFRTLNTGPGTTRSAHNVVTEFRASATNPNIIDMASEVRLFAQRDEASNHNGGDLHFGPDGYLYVAVGDEGGGNDSYGNGQRIDRDLFAGLLRIDVDGRPGSLPPNRNAANAWMFTTNYAIPADNPFVGAASFNGVAVVPANVRTEFYAVGLRNPWRFSFDPATGDLWVADVGQDKWEMVFVSRKGANHGWPFREGRVAGPRTGMPTGFLTAPGFNHVPPLHVYAHGSGNDRGNSITGGRVYRGGRITALHGAYVFADYVNNNVWALRRDAAGAATVERLGTLAGVAGFGVDPANGDLLALQLNASKVMRLVASANVADRPVPGTLQATGAFRDIASLEPAGAFLPYEVNLPFWSDHALKQRWVHVPPGTRVDATPGDAWRSPAGTVWMKHFEMEMERGVASSRRRLETRFLVQMAQGVYGVTYRWTTPTDAVLVPDEGANETLWVMENGQSRPQDWRYPSRSECIACHNPAAGGSLSFNTRQLDRMRALPGGAGTVHQVRALAAAGYVELPSAGVASPPSFNPEGEPESSLEWQVRRYLDVNCGLCHRPGGPGGGTWDGRATTPTDLAGLIDGPVVTDGGVAGGRILVAGDRGRSVLLDRMTRMDGRRMPPVGSREVDAAGVALVSAWIDSLVARPSFEGWLATKVSLADGETADPGRDRDGDGEPDHLEFLAGTHPGDAGSGWRPQVAVRDGRVFLQVRVPANAAVSIETMDALDGTWRAWEPRAPLPFFPAKDREAEVELPGTERALWVRLGLRRP
jgi:glucose/arabinose dehydrogenase